MTNTADIKVGSFYVRSWGYDQTNVDFYKIVGVTASGKSVKVQHWSQTRADNSGESFHDSVVPGEKPRKVSDFSNVTPDMDYWDRKKAIIEKDAPVTTHRINGNSIKINSYDWAYLWDGKPEYQTAAGFGH